MIRTLVLIAITGFFVAVVSLSAAFAIGGPELATSRWAWFDRWDDGDHRHRHRGDDDDRQKPPEASTISRDITWDGSSKVQFDIPVAVEFTQTAGPGKVTITGPRDAVERVVLSGGRLSFREPMTDYVRLRVVMTAPAVTEFDLGGDNRLEINDYKQDRLAIVASGSAEVSAEGEAKAVELDLSGSSEADLSDLTSESAKAEVSGSSQAKVAPKASGVFDVSGSGEVKLSTRPQTLSTDVAGSGRVIYDDGSEALPTRDPDLPASAASKT